MIRSAKSCAAKGRQEAAARASRLSVRKENAVGTVDAIQAQNRRAVEANTRVTAKKERRVTDNPNSIENPVSAGLMVGTDLPFRAKNPLPVVNAGRDRLENRASMV